MEYGTTAKEIRRERLKELRKGFSSHPEMAERIPNMSAGFLSQLINGHRELGDKLARKIEKALGKPAGWMDAGGHQLSDIVRDEPTNEFGAAPIGPTGGRLPQVPLISWVAAGNWAEAADPYCPGDGEEMVEVTRRVGPHAFALRVSGDSMEPTFPQGCVIVVDPDTRAENGSYVIVRLEADSEATFKQLVIDGGRKYLKPLNTRYPIIEINGEATTVGVVREARLHFE